MTDIMSTSQGKFIVIDGSDGSGKKTQTDLLIDELKNDGREVSSYDFPQYDQSFFGALVGRYLNGEFGKTEKISPYLISILYAGDRWQAADKIRKDLAEGRIVVSNRYMQSNMAYSGARFADEDERKKFLDWLYELEFQIFQIPKPDLVLYLYVPYLIGQKLVDNKAKRSYTLKKRDIHEQNGEYLKKVEETYLWLAENYSEWRKIDCAKGSDILPIEDIQTIIYKVVSKELGENE